jgi:putative peptidoglycan lipid II flippase
VLESIRGALAPLRARWRAIAGALGVIAGTTLLANALTFGQDALIARTYGNSPLLDSYFFGLALVMFLANVFGSAFGNAVVPAYLRAQESGPPESAASTLGVATRLGLVFLGIVVAVSVIVAPALIPLLVPRFDDERRALAERVIVLFSPIVLFTAFSQVWAGLLNAKGRFAMAGASAAARPVVVIATLLALGKPTLLLLAGAVTLGHGGTATVLAVGLRRLGVPVGPRRGPANEALLGARRQYVALALGTLFTSAMVVTDQAVASRFRPGTIATLSYAQKLALLPTVVTVAVISAVLLPRFSILAAKGDLARLRRARTQSTFIAVAFGTLVAFVMAALAEPLTRLAFQRGAFGPEAVVAVAHLLRLSVVQLPFILAGSVLTHFLVATQHFDRAWIGLAVSPVLNLALDVVLGRLWGIDGVVWSSVVVAVYSAAYYYVMGAVSLRRDERNRRREGEPAPGAPDPTTR